MNDFFSSLFAYIAAVSLFQLLSVPFYLLGGTNWGLSASAIILFVITARFIKLLKKWKDEKDATKA